MLSEKCGKFFFFYASHDRNIRRRHFDCATAGNTDDWRRPSAAVGRVTRRPSRRSTTETPPESHPPHSIGHRATVFPCPTRGRNTSPSRFTADWCAPLKIAHASRSAFDPTQFGTSVHVGGVGFFFFFHFSISTYRFRFSFYFALISLCRFQFDRHTPAKMSLFRSTASKLLELNQVRMPRPFPPPTSILNAFRNTISRLGSALLLLPEHELTFRRPLQLFSTRPSVLISHRILSFPARDDNRYYRVWCRVSRNSFPYESLCVGL